MPEAMATAALITVAAPAAATGGASPAPGAGGPDGLFGGFLEAARSLASAPAGPGRTAGAAPAPSPLLGGIRAPVLPDEADADDEAEPSADSVSADVAALAATTIPAQPFAASPRAAGALASPTSRTRVDADTAKVSAPTGASMPGGTLPAAAGPDGATSLAGAAPAAGTLPDAFAAIAAATADPDDGTGAPPAGSTPGPSATGPTTTAAQASMAALATAVVTGIARAGIDALLSEAATLQGDLAPSGETATTDMPVAGTAGTDVGPASSVRATPTPPPAPPAVAATAADDAAGPAPTSGAASDDTRDTGPAGSGTADEPAPTVASAATAAMASTKPGQTPDAFVEMVLGLVSGRTRDAAASTETNLRETALGALAAADAGRQVRATRPEIAPARADPAGQAADPAAEVARSTVTRDTAGTALAAAIIASSPETRPTGRRPAAQGGQAGPVAFAGAASASTPSAAAATATGSTPDAATTPPPQAGTGIAAAASAFAERVRAIAGERADAAPTTAASTTTGSGTGPASLPTSTQAGGAGSAAASLSGGGQAGATIVPQLAAEIVRRVSAGETRFQIRLDPAELGRVDVRLSLDDGGEARAQLLVERRETYDLIARDHRVLERTLREAGYEVRDGSVQVTLKQNGDSGGGHGGQNQGGAFDRMAQQQQQQHGQNPHAGNQRGDQGYPASSRPETDTVDTDLVTRLAAFAARPGPGNGRIDIRV